MISDLDFCSAVAYAVPSSPSLNGTQLAKVYDDYAAKVYKNFSLSLQQIPCNASDTERYSLATGCDQCAASYKQWLCAVTIPRCHDFSSTLPYLLPRNLRQSFINGSTLPDKYPGLQAVLTNSSRNPFIDNEIKPGPYKEVLPCRELCYQLVRDCPSALGFVCPRKKWLEASYGFLTGAEVTCNSMGVEYQQQDGGEALETRSIDFGVGARVYEFWDLVRGLGTSLMRTFS